jgi:cellobiose phosphorylase
MPAAYNHRAEIRQMEPYVHGQTTYSIFSPRPGNTRVAWLTGAAAWWYYAVTQYVLGIRPDIHGIKIDPCIPSNWKGFKVERKFRKRLLHIDVENTEGVCRGVKSIILNGEKVGSNFIRIEQLADENVIKVILGSN